MTLCRREEVKIQLSANHVGDGFELLGEGIIISNRCFHSGLDLWGEGEEGVLTFQDELFIRERHACRFSPLLMLLPHLRLPSFPRAIRRAVVLFQDELSASTVMETKVTDWPSVCVEG